MNAEQRQVTPEGLRAVAADVRRAVAALNDRAARLQQAAADTREGAAYADSALARMQDQAAADRFSQQAGEYLMEAGRWEGLVRDLELMAEQLEVRLAGAGITATGAWLEGLLAGGPA